VKYPGHQFERHTGSLGRESDLTLRRLGGKIRFFKRKFPPNGGWRQFEKKGNVLRRGDLREKTVPSQHFQRCNQPQKVQPKRGTGCTVVFHKKGKKGGKGRLGGKDHYAPARIPSLWEGSRSQSDLSLRDKKGLERGDTDRVGVCEGRRVSQVLLGGKMARSGD